MAYTLTITNVSNNFTVAQPDNNVAITQTSTSVTINPNATIIQTKNTADTYKGVWASGTAYLRGDTVKYNETLYLAVNNVPSNVINPAAASTDYWVVYSVSASTSTFNTLTVVTSLVAKANSAITLLHADVPTTLSVHPTTANFIIDNDNTVVNGRLIVYGNIEGHSSISTSEDISASKIKTYGTFTVADSNDESVYLSIGLNPDLLPTTKLSQIVSTQSSILIDSNDTIYIGQAKVSPATIRINGPTTLDRGDLTLAGTGRGIYFPDGSFQSTAATTSSGSTSTFANSISVGGIIHAGLSYSSISGTSQQQLDNFAVAGYDTAKYLVKIKDGGDYHIEEIVIVYDGTNIELNQYGIITNNGLLGSFTADVSGSNVRLLFTPNGATTMSIKVAKTLMAV